MFCPKCATQNGEDSKFCRACGTNLSMVPQAITGQLTLSKRQRRELERGRSANMAHGITTLFTGFGFLLVALAVSMARSVAGQVWWYWMLIPAFTLLGKGVAEIVSVVQAQKEQQRIMQQLPQQSFPQPRKTGEVLSPPTDEYQHPPISVTETTTRHLDAVPPRNRDIQ
jgi:hypothetical protein